MKILALVLAGGQGSRLYPLTADHAKPALPFAEGFRIVDFVLSNLVNSRVSTIYVLAQYKPESLVRHIDESWSSWFTGPERFVKVLLPRRTSGFQGTADAVAQTLDVVRAHRPDLVAVFAADHVYRMDVRQMADFHRARAAEVTVAAVAVPRETASSFGVIVAERGGRILQFQEKPARPAPIPGRPDRAYASMGNYLFQPEVLEEVLEERRERDTDFGHHLLPRIAPRRRVFAYDFSTNLVPGVQEFEERSYWRDVGTPTALAAARLDALGQRPRFNLWNRRWPIRGEHDAALFARIRGWREQMRDAPPAPPAARPNLGNFETRT